MIGHDIDRIHCEPYFQTFLRWLVRVLAALTMLGIIAAWMIWR